MAKNTQEAEVIVTLNGQAAKRAIKEMEQEYERLTKAALEAHKAGNDALGKELDAQAEKLTRDIQITRRETKKFADVMKNINGASLKELRSAAKQLQSEINKLAPGTQAFIEKSKQLQQVNTRIRQLTNEFKGLVVEEKQATFSLKGLADGFNKYFGMVTAGIAAITGLSMAFRKAAEDAARLDDVYSDVMKTTGLLHEQVAELDRELMKIDTRTSREQLLLLARDAGKLGITGKEDILGFVRAADQIQVALGEDLGEGAIKNLGKIADVFGLTKEMGIEKSLLSIASAVNALGQASTASEAYLVDFTQRLAGVGAMAGLSVQDILGFASGLDQSAMKVEMAATAFQKFLMSMYEEPAKFAKYAGMQVEEFTELLKTNANEAITVVMKAMNGQDGFAAMVPVFNEMGLDGARAVGVLSAMTKNLDAVTEAQRLANVEFAKGTSVTEEYNTKNNNLQAQLEKARKEFQNASIALGQSLNPIMLKSTKLTTHLIKALASYGKEMGAAAIAIAVVTLAIKRQALVQTGLNVVQKVGNTLRATANTIIWAARTAIFRLIGATEAATIAQQQLNAVMSASVIGVVALAVGGLTAAITHWVKKSREANAVNERMEEIQKRINSEYAEGAGKVQALTNIVHNNNLELDQRRRALNELKSIVPGYHADLTEEGRLINDNTEALKEYLKNLEKVTRQKILQEEYEKAVSEVMAAEQAVADAQKAKDEALVNAGGDTTTIRAFTMQSTAGAYGVSEITPYGKALREETDAQDDLNKKKEVQLEIEQRINNEFGIRAGQVSDEERAIRQVNERYKQLFNDAREMNRDNPAAAEERIQQLKTEQSREIAEIHKNHAEKRTVETEETATTNAILTQAQFDYLQERQEKLTKKEKAMVDAGYAALSDEDSKALKARYDKLMKADNKAADQRYQADVKSIEQHQRAEQNLINAQFFNRDITAEQHEEKLVEIKVKYLEEKKALAERYGQDTSAIEEQLLAAEVARHKFYYDKEMKLCEKRWMEEEIGLRQQLSANAITQEEFDKRMLENKEKHLREQQELALGYNQDGSGIQLKDIEARQKEEERALKQSLMSQKVTQEEYDRQMLETKLKYLQQRLQLARQGGQDETAILQEILAAQVEAEELAMKQMAKLKEDAKKVVAGLDPSSARKSELEEQLKQLQVLHDAKLLSEQQYEEAVKQMRKKYADEDLNDKLGNIADYIDKANKMMEGASNFVTSLKEAESAKLEEQYQADLTAAGDNAERREQIEAEYEEKKLDLQKKYADVEMAINIAKTIANGAAAAIRAYLDGGAYAGPVLAALVAATTAAEVATIVAQRNAIKNASVSSGGGSSSAPTTGERKMTGYGDGGFTDRAANDHKVVGVVHANEYVAPAWMVRENPTVFANLEQYRKNGSHGRSGSVSQGFADGGFTLGNGGGLGGAIGAQPDIEAAVEAAIRRVMEDGAIRAYLVRKDLTELDNQTQKFKKLGSR